VQEQQLNFFSSPAKTERIFFIKKEVFYLPTIQTLQTIFETMFFKKHLNMFLTNIFLLYKPVYF